MSKQEIASLACKILGIYIIIQGINVLSSVLYVSIATPNLMANESLINIIFSLMYIFIGVLLWLLSDKLSAIMVTGENHYNEGSGIQVGDIQRVAFSVLGLFFLGNSLPKLVSTLTNEYFMSGSPYSTTRLMLEAGGTVVQLIVGLGIFLGSQGLVNFLNTIRTAGLKREDDYEEKE
jgi:hypothetical protein